MRPGLGSMDARERFVGDNRRIGIMIVIWFLLGCLQCTVGTSTVPTPNSINDLRMACSHVKLDDSDSNLIWSCRMKGVFPNATCQVEYDEHQHPNSSSALPQLMYYVTHTASENRKDFNDTVCTLDMTATSLEPGVYRFKMSMQPDSVEGSQHNNSRQSNHFILVKHAVEVNGDIFECPGVYLSWIIAIPVIAFVALIIACPVCYYVGKRRSNKKYPMKTDNLTDVGNHSGLEELKIKKARNPGENSDQNQRYKTMLFNSKESTAMSHNERQKSIRQHHQQQQQQKYNSLPKKAMVPRNSKMKQKKNKAAETRYGTGDNDDDVYLEPDQSEAISVPAAYSKMPLAMNGNGDDNDDDLYLEPDQDGAFANKMSPRTGSDNDYNNDDELYLEPDQGSAIPVSAASNKISHAMHRTAGNNDDGDDDLYLEPDQDGAFAVSHTQSSSYHKTGIGKSATLNHPNNHPKPNMDLNKAMLQRQQQYNSLPNKAMVPRNSKNKQQQNKAAKTHNNLPGFGRPNHGGMAGGLVGGSHGTDEEETGDDFYEPVCPGQMHNGDTGDDGDDGLYLERRNTEEACEYSNM